ncbi:MAG: O-antigen ligase family protein [Phycisphaerales bacterium]
MAGDRPTIARAGVLARGLTILIALLACTRAMLAFDPIPGWGLDPYTIAAPAGAFGPREAALVDVLTLLLAGLVLLLTPPARWKAWLPWVALLVVLGAVGLVHGVPDGPRPADLAPALAWLAALAGAGAIARGAADAATRRTVIALLAGFTAMLFAKGLVQLLVEHPATVAQFDANRAQMLAAQGLEDGTAGARAFERRLRQPEVTGWIGFSNATASLLAAGGVALASMAFTKRKGAAVVAGLGALVAIALVVYGSSKGAMAAVVLGLGCVALGRLAPRVLGAERRRAGLAWVLAGAAVLGPILALVARGMVGQAIGELSLLFRWFYVEAATRIAFQNPLLGVGPGGFKDAYAVAKNPISPENAASPHSVFFDAAATMGLLVGAGVVVLVGYAAWRAARGVVEREAAGEEVGRFPRLALVAGPALAVVVGARLELQSVGGLTMALALAWLLGLAGWVALAWAAWRGEARGAMLGAAAAALVLIAHGQIEMTPVLIGSASLWAAWLGVAVARDEVSGLTPGPARAVGVVPVLLAVVIAALALPGLWAWQGKVGQAAMLARQPAEYRTLLEASGGDPRVVRAVAEELSLALGQRVGPSTLGPGLRAFAARSAAMAATAMDGAVRVAPADGPTLRTASRAWLIVAIEGEPGAADRALELARAAANASPASAQNWGHLASVIQRLDGDGTGDHAGVDRVLEALDRAVELNPASPQLRHRRFEVARDAGRLEAALGFALGALEADDRMALDRLGAGLSEAQRAELEAFVGGG